MSALLFSTTGVTISRHYCMGTLVETAYYTEAGSCHKQAVKECRAGEHFEKKGCCEDEELSFPGIKLENTPAKKWIFFPPLLSLLRPTTIAYTDFRKDPQPLRPKVYPLAAGNELLIKVQRFLI